MHIGNGVRAVGGSAFYASGAQNITIEDGTTTIGNNAFYNCKQLKTLVFPNSVTSYGSNMIYGCSALEELTVGGTGLATGNNSDTVFVVGSTNSLKKLVVLEGVKAIGEKRFANSQFYGYGFKKLETVLLPDSLISIGSYAFNQATSLQSIRIPDSVTSIQSNTFGGVSNLLLYTDTYNEYVANYAAAHASQGFTYEVMDPESYPYVDMTYVYPDGETILQPVRFMNAIVPPEAKAIAGQRFIGWYWNDTFTLPLREGDLMRAGAGTLYARYETESTAAYLVRVPVGRTISAITDTAGIEVPKDYILWALVPQLPGERVALPVPPSAEGYVFTGWYTDRTFTKAFTVGDMPAAGLTLYGRFSPAGSGGLYTRTVDGYTITDYRLTEQDSDTVILPYAAGGFVVEAIAATAFNNAPGMKRLTIPAGVRYIAPSAFENAALLTDISVDSGNEAYTSMAGVLYSKDRTVLYRYPRGRLGASFTVPASVRVIAPYAFSGCENLKSITFSSGLNTIDSFAFMDCVGLKTITLPDSVTMLGSYAFWNCYGLYRFTAPALGSVGSHALPGNVYLLVNGPVGEGALREYCHAEGSGLSNNYNIRYVTVMENGEAITMLTLEAGVPLPSNAVISKIDDTTLRRLYQDSTGTLVWPVDEPVPDRDITLYAIREPVFATESCTVTEGETEHTGVRITGYNGLGGSITLPASLYGQPLLAIGDYALAGAKAPVTSLYIPGSVLEIADHALESLDGERYDGVILADADTYAAAWAEQHGYGVQRATYLLSFETNGGASIGDRQMTGGGELRLPDPVRTGWTFAGWYLDAALTAPAALSDTGFYTMPLQATRLYAAWTFEGEMDWQFEESDGAITVTGYTGTETVLTIPGEINSLPVTGLSDGALSGLSGVTVITVPDTVLTLGDGCFSGCDALVSLHLGAGVHSVGSGILRGADGLQVITVSADNPALKAVSGCLMSADETVLYAVPADAAFAGLPASVTKIAPYAFSGHKHLTSLALPETVTSVGRGALENCAALTTLVLDTDVPAWLAEGCTALTAVTLGSQVTEVGSGAFQMCKALTRVETGAGLASIADNAFSGAGTGLTLYGTLGSYAHTWAAAQGYPFVDPDAVQPESIEIIAESDSLAIGESMTLSAVLQPENAVSGIAWQSSAPDVAIVEDGLVRALKRGTVTVLALTDNGLTAAVSLTVRGVPAEEVILTNIPADLAVGDAWQLDAVILPDEAEDEAPIWTVSEAALIDETGLLTGAAAGTATIRASAISGRYDEAAVMIYEPVTGILPGVEQDEITLTAVTGYNTLQLPPVLEPQNATIQTLDYASSDPTVVTVDENGLLTALKPGEAVISLSTIWTHMHEPLTVELAVHVAAVDLSETQADPMETVWTDLGMTAPRIRVTWQEYELIPGTDYTVAMDAEPAPGEHTAVLTGKGSFAGILELAYDVAVRPVPNLSLSSLTLALGQTVTVPGWAVYGENTPERVQAAYALTWESSDPDVAVIDETGRLQALGAGTATIILGGNAPEALTASLTVTVEDGSAWRAFVLPAQLTAIESEAFAGVPADTVTAGGALQTMQADAFNGAVCLKQIILNGSPAEISPDALNGTGAVLLIPDDPTLAARLRSLGLPYAIKE